MKNIFTIIALLSLTVSVSAQRIKLDISFSGDTVGISKVYVMPLNVGVENKNVALRFKDGSYSGNIRVSGTGLYNLVAVRNYTQLSVNFAIDSQQDTSLDVKVEGVLLTVDNTPCNTALSALSAEVYRLDRELWDRGTLTAEEQKSLIKGYAIAADSLAGLDGVTPAVAGYMKVHAYARAYSSFASIPRALKIPVTAVPFSRNEVLPSPRVVFDNDYASLVYSVPMVIKEEIPASKSLFDRFDYLYTYYKNDAVRKNVAASIMSDFLSKYNYSADFEGGLELVKSVTEKYSLSQAFVEAYMKRKSTIVGSPFPEDVTLVNAQGEKVDFSTFKGKYVYVDMWASWCNPCCKEVPHLQKLEKELKNKDVVFVSISSDSDVKAWKNKMTELDMHGVQLLDSGNSLGNALNVKMIPFFVIYDKEGKLHTYGALRPSTGEKLKEVLEGLK